MSKYSQIYWKDNKAIWKWLLTAIFRQIKMDKSILD